MADRHIQAPETPAINTYKLNFGNSTNLEFSEDTKLVEAHASFHRNKPRVTLLYKGLAAFTFELCEAKKLQEASDWSGSYKDPSQNEPYDFHVNLKFGYDRKSASGQGVTDLDTAVDVKIKLRPKESNTWSGYYDTEGEMHQIFL